MIRTALVAFLLPFVAAPLSAQDIKVADSLFTAGQRALECGDTAGYLRNADSAAKMMPAGNLNRPFVQYHAGPGQRVYGASDSVERLAGQNAG